VEFVRWVTENNRPFQIVNDHGLQVLMKTGRPECYIPSAETLSRDIKNVFVCIHGHIAKGLQVSMLSSHDNLITHLALQDYNGKLNFATDRIASHHPTIRPIWQSLSTLSGRGNHY